MTRYRGTAAALVTAALLTLPAAHPRPPRRPKPWRPRRGGSRWRATAWRPCSTRHSS